MKAAVTAVTCPNRAVHVALGAATSHSQIKMTMNLIADDYHWNIHNGFLVHFVLPCNVAVTETVFTTVATTEGCFRD